MSAAAKRRLVYGTLVFLTVWPLAHVVLVQRAGLSSWKLCGWGMYATPRPATFGMDVYGRAGGGDWQRLQAPSPALAEHANGYLERFRWLGSLVSPESVGRMVLAEHPEWDEVRLDLFQTDVERASGMVVMRRTEHRWAR